MSVRRRIVRNTVARPTARAWRTMSSTEKCPLWARTAAITATRDGVIRWSSSSSLRMTDSSSDMAVRRSISETKYHRSGAHCQEVWRGKSGLARELGEEEHLAGLLGARRVLYADADADGPRGNVLDVHAELADAVPSFEAAGVVDP